MFGWLAAWTWLAVSKMMQCDGALAADGGRGGVQGNVVCAKEKKNKRGDCTRVEKVVPSRDDRRWQASCRSLVGHKTDNGCACGPASGGFVQACSGVAHTAAVVVQHSADARKGSTVPGSLDKQAAATQTQVPL